MVSTDTGAATSTIDGNTQNMLPYNFGGIDLSGNVTTHHIRTNARLHSIAFTIADISNNAVVRFEGSMDGVRWFNMDTADTTVTANGTYEITAEDAVEFVRMKYVSRSTAIIGTITNIIYDGR